jgi:hypothetical protein
MKLRSELRPGDLGRIVQLHGDLYSREHGFDPTFEAYVAGPLAQFALAASPRERLWIAERRREIVGCVAIVAASKRVAQLRWFLVHRARGRGAGTAAPARRSSSASGRGMLHRSLDRARWRPRRASPPGGGFRKVESKPGRRWGAKVIEERYELVLGG